jgi:GAF domain-containing protein
MAPWSVLAGLEMVAAAHTESRDLEEMLARITRTAGDTIPRADYASIVVRYADGNLEPFAPTSPAISLADDLQCIWREGPCYDVVTTVSISHCDDLADDPRWPSYGKEVSAMGLRSQLAMRVHDGAGARIGLSLYSRDRAAFRHPIEAAGVLVDYAGMVLTSLGDFSRIRGAASRGRATREPVGYGSRSAS